MQLAREMDRYTLDNFGLCKASGQKIVLHLDQTTLIILCRTTKSKLHTSLEWKKPTRANKEGKWRLSHDDRVLIDSGRNHNPVLATQLSVVQRKYNEKVFSRKMTRIKQTSENQDAMECKETVVEYLKVRSCIKTLH